MLMNSCFVASGLCEEPVLELELAPEDELAAAAAAVEP
jgi:hypothetical protein